MTSPEHAAPTRGDTIERELRSLSRPMASQVAPLGAVGVAAGAIVMAGEWMKERPDFTRLGLLVMAVGVWLLCLVGIVAGKRALARARLQAEMAGVQADRLQRELDANFVTNLVRINFKYLDQYYLQTQLQASKSFALAAAAAVASFALVAGGVVIVFRHTSDAERLAGVVATLAGVISQFIAALFFYLYNGTVTRMGEYHQKLVLTQNLALALRITEELEGGDRSAAQLRLVDYLAADINSYLTRGPAAAPQPQAEPERETAGV